MLRFIGEIIIKAKLNRENSKRKKGFLSWQHVEKIALLIEQEDSLHKNEIDKFITDTQKYVEVFYIELKSKQSSFGDWHCFTRKDKSIFGLPKSSGETLAKDKKYDLIINTCSARNLFALSLSNSINATLYCSSVNIYNEADLIVKRLEGQKLLNYLNNTLIYLKMIKT